MTDIINADKLLEYADKYADKCRTPAYIDKLVDVLLQLRITDEEEEQQSQLHEYFMDRELRSGEELSCCNVSSMQFFMVEGVLLQRILKLTMSYHKLSYFCGAEGGADWLDKMEDIKKERELLLQYAAFIFFPEFKSKIMEYKRRHDCE